MTRAGQGRVLRNYRTFPAEKSALTLQRLQIPVVLKSEQLLQVGQQGVGPRRGLGISSGFSGPTSTK